MDDILSTCRSLRHLSVVTNRAIQYNITNDDANNSEATAPLAKATDYYYELRTFAIRYRGETLNRILQDIIRRSPKLRAFGTNNGCHSRKTLQHLDQFCPRLKILYITPEPQDKIKLDDINNDEDADQNDEDGISNSNSGLGTLGVDRMVVFEPSDLMPFFQKSQNTLQTIELELGDPQRMKLQDWAPLATMGLFPNVKRLFYSSNDRSGSTDTIAVPLLQRLSALETVEFEYIGHINSRVIDTLTALTRLRSLSIRNSDMNHGIRSFFEHHAGLNDVSTLKEVSLIYAHPLTDTLLNALADITTLNKINIRGSSEGVTKQGVKAFIRKYASRSNVANLSLSQLKHVPFVEVKEMLNTYKN